MSACSHASVMDMAELCVAIHWRKNAELMQSISYMVTESSYRASGEAIVICGLMHVFTHHLGLTQFASDHVFDIE